jgi:hypothetical protein
LARLPFRLHHYPNSRSIVQLQISVKLIPFLEGARLLRIIHTFCVRTLWLIVGILAATTVAVPSQAAVEGHFDRSFPVQSAVKIEVVTDSGDISVRAGEAGKVEIHARLHGSEEPGDQNVEGRVRAIEANPPAMRVGDGKSIRIGHFGNPELAQNIAISYEIVVPADAQVHSETSAGEQTVEGVQGPVEATSGSGNLHVWHIASQTRVETGSGDIDLRDIHGRIYAKAGTGSIRAAGIIGELNPGPHAAPGPGQPVPPGPGRPFALQPTPSADLEVLTGSGDVDVQDLEGGLQVMTGSGTIHVSGKPVSDWRLDTGTGTVRVQLPEQANFALVAHTSSGTIENHRATAEQRNTTPRDLRVQTGHGGPTVDLRTASGNIEIE